MVLRRKFGPEGNSASGKERAGSDVRFWNFAVSQKLSSKANLAPKENPQVGESGLGATSFLELCGFSKMVLRMKFGPEGKSASGKERAGSGFRFWNFAVSQKLSSGCFVYRLTRITTKSIDFKYLKAIWGRICC